MHTLTLTNHTFTCPVCTFRAVLTTDNRIVLTQAGDADHDHIGQARAMVDAARSEQRAYIERICDRLRRHYADRDALPTGEQMSLNMLQRFYRCAMTEYSL